jgi:hypothetical protein
MRERLIDRLRKIEALARSGVDGEQENAQRMLSELCERYNVTMDQIIQAETRPYEFFVRDAIDETLLIQIVGYICQIHNIPFWRRGRTRRILELTITQGEDVRECYEHYRKVWRAQLKDLMHAFIQTNNIFGPPNDPGKEDTPEEIEQAMRIAALVNGMKRDQWTKRRQLEEIL